MGQKVLPIGYRFHPSDEELVYLLSKRISKEKGKDDDLGDVDLYDNDIGDVDLYKYEPWELPEKSRLRSGDTEWFFYHARRKKYHKGLRTNRATEEGFWKATGKGKKVTSGGGTVGIKQTFVFHRVKEPVPQRTDWTMHEYRLDEETVNDPCFVLCRIQKKNGLEPRHDDENGAPFLDEGNEATFPTESINLDVANHGLSVPCDIEVELAQCEFEEELVNNFKQSSTATGNLDIPFHATTGADPGGLKGWSLLGLITYLEQSAYF